MCLVFLISVLMTFHVSNQHVLVVTATLFALFVGAEIVGALAGHSLSLLGDAAAMSVDVFTYGANLYAERIKSSGREIDEPTRMILEVYVPTFSVCALLAVTAWITSDAIHVVVTHGQEDEDTDVNFMYGYSAGGMVVDIIASAMFAWRGGDGLRTIDDDGPLYNPLLPHEEDQVKEIVFSTEEGSVRVNSGMRRSLVSRLNLNMYAALTHVGGDTLRTISVFVAAVVASATNIPNNVCDAWASIIVTLTIIAVVCPLIYHIYQAAKMHSLLSTQM